MIKELGVDLGTSYIRICQKGRGIISRTPTVVAVDTKSRGIVAIGAEAKRMIGKTPSQITAYKPIRHGAIADCDVLPDILVANASIQMNIPWSEFDLVEAHREMEVNFHATLRMFQLAYPKMKAQGWGRLIAVGSVQEPRPHPQMCAYAASKAAQENLVRNVARQVAREGITVNNLCPGVFATDRNAAALGNPVYAEKVMNAIPMHDYARPEDAAGAALLLASDAGRYITGSTIVVDGGLRLPG